MKTILISFAETQKGQRLSSHPDSVLTSSGLMGGSGGKLAYSSFKESG